MLQHSQLGRSSSTSDSLGVCGSIVPPLMGRVKRGILVVHVITGQCHCGNIRVEMTLPRAMNQYAPRACDCSFCRMHGAAYVSDPQGHLRIHIRDEGMSQRYHQGSGTAELLLCRNCGVLIGGLYRDGGRLFGTININVAESSAVWGRVVSASPQQLTPAEKAARWKALWFADVVVAGESVGTSPDRL